MAKKQNNTSDEDFGLFSNEEMGTMTTEELKAKKREEKENMPNRPLDYVLVKLTDCEAYEPYSDAIYSNDKSFYYLPETKEEMDKISSCFNFNKKYSRKMVKSILPEMDEDIQKELRACMIQCGIEVYLRDYDDEINVSELMLDDIKNGLFKPQNKHYRLIEDRDDALCEMFNEESALCEWFYWETGEHIPSMTPEEMETYVSERFMEVADKVINPDVDYKIKFVTK